MTHFDESKCEFLTDLITKYYQSCCHPSTDERAQWRYLLHEILDAAGFPRDNSKASPNDPDYFSRQDIVDYFERHIGHAICHEYKRTPAESYIRKIEIEADRRDKYLRSRAYKRAQAAWNRPQKDAQVLSRTGWVEGWVRAKIEFNGRCDYRELLKATAANRITKDELDDALVLGGKSLLYIDGCFELHDVPDLPSQPQTHRREIEDGDEWKYRR